ncbi:YmL10 [Terramyces sp. JEL0728]|nr:YmL10 [Terramyces sp. JEL0728]
MIARMNMFRRIFPISPYSTRIFKPLTNEQAVYALDNVKKSRRGNPVDHRRTFWYAIYSQILQSKYIFVFQNVNIPAATFKKLKLDIAGKMETLSVCNGVFRACCKDNKLEKFANLFQGPTTILFSNQEIVPDVVKIGNKYKQHLILVGGKLDDFMVTSDTFEDVKKLPSKAQLLGELLGVLSYPAANISRVLQQSPMVLAASLEQYSKQENKQ